MDYRIIGYFLILAGVLQLAIGFVAKDQINTLKLAQLPPSCHVGNDPNTCAILKDSVDAHIVLLWLIGILQIAIGAYMGFFEKEHAEAKLQHRQILNQVTKMGKEKDLDDRFEILLKGLDEPEQKILRAVRAHDGIGQNTLAIRTELSKTKVSLVISDLEKRNLVRKVPEGKTNRIFLKQAM